MRLIESKKRKYTWNDIDKITEDGIILIICEDVEVTYNYRSYWTSYGGDEDWDSIDVDPYEEGWEGYLVEKEEIIDSLTCDSKAKEALKRNMKNYLGDDFNEDEWEDDYDKIWEMLYNNWYEAMTKENIMTAEDSLLYVNVVLNDFAELSIEDAEEWVYDHSDDIAEELENDEPDWDSMPGGPDDDDRWSY